MSTCMYCPCPQYQGERCRCCFETNNTEIIHSVTRCEVCEEIMCVHTLPRTVCEMCEGCTDYDTDDDHDYMPFEPIDHVHHDHTPFNHKHHNHEHPIIKCVAGKDHEKRDCTICLNGFRDGEPLGQLRCHPQHTFHIECISEWFRKSITCPICRIKS